MCRPGRALTDGGGRRRGGGRGEQQAGRDPEGCGGQRVKHEVGPHLAFSFDQNHSPVFAGEAAADAIPGRGSFSLAFSRRCAFGILATVNLPEGAETWLPRCCRRPKHVKFIATLVGTGSGPTERHHGLMMGLPLHVGIAFDGDVRGPTPVY